MGSFYFDESIHVRGGFIIGAWVYTENDIEATIAAALERHGVNTMDEFKSGARMDEDPKRSEVRLEMQGLLQETRIGLVVAPVEARSSLGNVALDGLRKIITANGLTKLSHKVFLDQGIEFEDRDKAINESLAGLDCIVRVDCDSREVKGIQLADLAAHSMSTMLLETMGIVTKKTKAGPNTGYDPDTDIEIGFELWASLRYQFFTQDRPNFDLDPLEGQMLDTATYALHIADSCSEKLRGAAMERFGKCWMGCIH